MANPEILPTLEANRRAGRWFDPLALPASRGRCSPFSHVSQTPSPPLFPSLSDMMAYTKLIMNVFACRNASGPQELLSARWM